MVENDYYNRKVMQQSLLRSRDPWRVTWTRWTWIKSRIGAFILRCRIAGGWVKNPHQLTRDELDPPTKWDGTQIFLGEHFREEPSHLRHVPWRLVNMSTEQALDETAKALGYGSK